MAIDLDSPLGWTTADDEAQAMLDDLQANILDGHGRKATRLLFLRFGDDRAAARAFVQAMAPEVKSAAEALVEAREHRLDPARSGTPFVGFMLSAAGYAALGVTDKAPDVDDQGAFAEGMLARAARLNDDPAKVELAYSERPHALILIGGDPDAADAWTSQAVADVEQRLRGQMGAAAAVVAEETGRAIFRKNGVGPDGRSKLEGIEHFGYVDGRSQPLMLTEHIERERTEGGGIDRWNPAFPLRQVLVADPGSAADTAFGSFFVFRKLEQDIAAFKFIERKIGDDTGLGELAGAMLVGRFENGTPVVLREDEDPAGTVPNDFGYDDDADGLRCPLHAHIRKTNPRGDSVRELERFGVTLEQERSHIMARRGMPFGTRDRVIDPTDQPEKGVGLMFMAFQSNLANQFEFTQQSWANEAQFVRGTLNGKRTVGRDPIIGQRHGHDRVPIHVPDKWDDPDATIVPMTLAESVHHRGGEYFFAPARSTLSAI